MFVILIDFLFVLFLYIKNDKEKRNCTYVLMYLCINTKYDRYLIFEITLINKLKVNLASEN